jgi:hypothetical protein
VSDQVWIVGLYRSGKMGSVVWDLCGVYTDRSAAIAAIKANGEQTLFLSPIWANQFFGLPVEAFPEIEWPNGIPEESVP